MDRTKSQKNGRLDSQRLLLTGIAIASGLSAVTVFITLKMNAKDFEMAAVWVSGSIYNANWKYIISMLLWLLFTQPQTYQTYIAGSPSIHWNKVILKEQEDQYLANLSATQLNHKLLMTTTELEREHPSNMSENARELYERLALLPREKLHVDYYVFEGEGHVSVLPALVSSAVRFLRRT
ncbi:hypothetical protein J2736_004710 [Paenibacillus qinlingensis]|uniref:Esterase n=1 Tax=Paenibacillus qinlingensis TaxID=1837343 RepID=A0ABU1P183_9BACL|nr:hypothetical protein [Paenibacillus qinlingensis]